MKLIFFSGLMWNSFDLLHELQYTNSIPHQFIFKLKKHEYLKADYTWKTPVLNSEILPLLLAAERFSEITDLVSKGSIMASTHKRDAA